MSILAVEVSWTQLGLISGGVIAGAGLVGTFLYKARAAFKTAESSASEEKAKLEQQTDQMREELLNKYREMWQVEKQRAERDIKSEIAELRKQVELLTERHRMLQADHDRLRAEYDRVMALNVALQEQLRATKKVD